MALKNRIVAFVAGVLLGPAIVWAGLETGTYISDLVVTNPLSSDLASTADDHIRLLKSTIKTTFPNINGAVTATDEQLNAIPAAANPTGTIGLTAVNGSAGTFLRSDGAPALSQAIAPTWTAKHIFGLAGTALNPSIEAASSVPIIAHRETDAAADNRIWYVYANNERMLYEISNDAGSSTSNWLIVDRTGTTVDSVAFPTDGGNAFVAGPVGGFTGVLGKFRTTTGGRGALGVNSSQAGSPGIATLTVQNELTAGDNNFVEFRTEAAAGTVRGTIDFNRAGTLTRYNTTSDIRLKKNFKPAPSARGVIECIRIESFDWRESGMHVDHGVVAQRLNKCAPYAVSKGDVWQVDKSTLIPAMIKYMQEQDARIVRLEADAARRH